jgi:5-deoxy-glucuronate isomerase
VTDVAGARTGTDTGELRDDDGVLIHRAKLPIRLPSEQLHVRPGADGVVSTDPERAGWRYLSFRAFSLADGEALLLDRPEGEAAVVTISGGGIDVRLEGDRRVWTLPGRSSVFDALPWAAYLPAGRATTITGRPVASGGRSVVALAQAPLTGRPGIATEPIVVQPADVEIEIRGRGNATRQVNNLMMPGFPADRLLLCEVFTPSGSWSGWPPHKHDVDDPPREAVLEETYYYQFRRPEGWAIQRIYHRDGSRDRMIPVRHGDLVVVDQGYHPFAATQGYDAYYLNVLAGDRRTMANTDDPDLAWVRTLWDDMEPDPRLPLVGR